LFINVALAIFFALPGPNLRRERASGQRTGSIQR
jgi:hypothetical protein